MGNIISLLLICLSIVVIYSFIKSLWSRKTSGIIETISLFLMVVFWVYYIIFGVVYYVKHQTPNTPKKIEWQGKEYLHGKKLLYTQPTQFKEMWVNAVFMQNYEPQIKFANSGAMNYNDLAMLTGAEPAKRVLLIDANLSENTRISEWMCSKDEIVKLFENRLLYSCLSSQEKNLNGIVVPPFSKVSLYNRYFKSPTDIDPIWKVVTRDYSKILTLSGWECARGYETSFLSTGTLLSCTITQTVSMEPMDIPMLSKVVLVNEDEVLEKDFTPIWRVVLRDITIKEEFFNEVILNISKGKIVKILGRKRYKKDETLADLKSRRR